MAKNLDVGIVGARIKSMYRLQDKPELMASEGWERKQGATMVLELENGVLLYPSCDDEGNAPGTLFGQTGAGRKFILWV